MMIPIFVLSFHRVEMTKLCLQYLSERTSIPITIHIWDNGSNYNEQQELFKLYQKHMYDSLNLLSFNSGTTYPKIIQHAMATTHPYESKYFVFNDADVYCPQISPCWLTKLIEIMDANIDLGCIAAQLPPQVLQAPYEDRGDHTLCAAVGNTLKVIRSSAWQKINKNSIYSDDFYICDAMRNAGYLSAFANDVWCLHAGQCENWGYTPEQVKEDPRKVGLGPPYIYKYDEITFKPQFNGCVSYL